MNKSKFLKRPLAALLAILMVVALVPMSAFAADDDTTTPAAPEYTVVVNNREAAFKDGGFDATVYSTYILSVALYGLPEGVKVDLLTKNGNVVPLTSTTAVDLKQEATLVSETERTSLYHIKLRETRGGEAKEYTLAVTVENAVPVDNVDIKAVRAKEGSIIDSVIGKDTVTLILPLGNGKNDVLNESNDPLASITSEGAATTFFVPENYNATATYNNTNETVTIKAADNSTKSYKVIFANEAGFTSFEVPDQIGETDVSDDGLTYSIKVPKGTELDKITPTWTYGENVVGVYSNGEPATGPKDPDTALGSAHSFPGVRSDRGWYNFRNAADNTITFFVVTQATDKQDKSAAVNVKVTPTDNYVGTGIKNFTVTVNEKDGSQTPLATNYKVTGNNTVYMPAGYNFGKNDTINLAITLDAGATASIISQNDPKLPSSSTSFTGIKTNGHQFTIQVQAEDKSVAPVNYRVNLVAASSSQAEISNKSGLRFQIGGDDGESMAATFDRGSQTDMTIKIPYNYMTESAGTPDIYGYEGASSDTPAVTKLEKHYNILPAPTPEADYWTTIDYSELTSDHVANAIEAYDKTAQTQFENGVIETWVKFSGENGRAVDLYAGTDLDSAVKVTTGSFEAEDTTTGEVKVEFGEFGSIAIKLGKKKTGPTSVADMKWGELFPKSSMDGTTYWADFSKAGGVATEEAAFVPTGVKVTKSLVSAATPGGDTDVSAELKAKKVYALVSNGASAYIGTDKTGIAIKNSITTFGNIWDTANGGIFHIYVCQNGVSRTYNIKLEQEDPRTGAKITAPATIGSSNVIGEMEEYTGTPVEKSDNNSLLKVGVGFNWNNTDYPTTYIYNGLEISDGAKAYVLNGNTGALSGLVDVTPDDEADFGGTAGDPVEFGSLTDKQIMPQADVEGLAVGADDVVNKDKSPVTTSLKEQIYVFSESEFARLESDNRDSMLSSVNTSADLKTLAGYAHVYNVYYERGTASNQAQLESISSSTPGVRATLDYTKTVNVRVPNSFNWTKYRDNKDCDFTLEFKVSEGAHLEDANGNWWSSGKTIFFVKDGELFMFNTFTGISKKITHVNGNESQTTELTVVSQDGTRRVKYPLTLTIAQPESNNKLAKVVVGETEAVINGSDVRVTLPAGSELKAQDVFITPDSDVATVQNDKGEAFDSTVKHDLSEPMKFTITAEDGTKAEYTLTATVGGDVPGPGGKPSDKYDLSDVYSGHLEDVKKAIDMGLMSGTGAAGKFNPKGKIARQDFALIIARADMKAENPDAEDIDALLREKYADAEESFNDISGLNDTQKAAVAHCKENGIISGNDKGGFDPKGDVTRQHAAVMIAGWCGLEHDDTANTNNIKDWNNVANWAKPYVNAVYKAGLMSGTGSDNFSPLGNLERQQAATVLVGAYEKKNAEVE